MKIKLYTALFTLLLAIGSGLHGINLPAWATQTAASVTAQAQAAVNWCKEHPVMAATAAYLACKTAMGAYATHSALRSVAPQDMQTFFTRPTKLLYYMHGIATSITYPCMGVGELVTKIENNARMHTDLQKSAVLLLPPARRWYKRLMTAATELPGHLYRLAENSRLIGSSYEY